MFLVVDFEATCWEKRKQPDLNELIEIGIVACSDDYEVLDTFSSVIRPVITKRISEQCRKLTGISQQEIDAADILPNIINKMNLWFSSSYGEDISFIKWGSWGSGDVSVLRRDCDRHFIPYPFGDHIDLERQFCLIEGINGIGAIKAIESKGYYFEGNPHRALNDALNIQKIAKYILLEKI